MFDQPSSLTSSVLVHLGISEKVSFVISDIFVPPFKGVWYPKIAIVRGMAQSNKRVVLHSEWFTG